MELFDTEKPETVRNFLLYVRSGAYSNSFLHRCVPGFVVQGGGFAVTNTQSSDRFSTYLSVTNYGLLTNEFLVGTRMSNILGTLAMAKVGSDPNSASSQWFFNLADNTQNLDNQNGGFTVFGRILESANTNDGLAIVDHFNRLSTNGGIVNLGSLLGSSYQVFNSLPVSYTNSITRVPLYRELYYVKMSLLNNLKPVGTNSPSLTITSPAPNSAFTNQTVTITGTAADDQEVAKVVYRVGDGPRLAAIGTTNWSVTLEPLPGFQTVTVESIDWDGNYSPAASLNFYFQRNIPLQLQITGQGTVSGVTNGQLLSISTLYTATATPLAGNIFEGWSGSVTSGTPTITFQPATNATNFALTAKFITDPLPTLTGAYHGLFQTLGPADFDGAGFMILTLKSDATFSGSIQYHGVTYYYTGKFDAAGNATVVGVVGGVNRTISLTLQKLNSAGLITGTFSGTSSTTLIQLERLAPSLPTTNAPPPGYFTFAIPLNTTNPPSALVPGGGGYGTGTVASAGTFTLSGTLGDGTAFNAAPKVTRLSKWPLFVEFDGGKGALWGWISYNTNQAPRLVASLTWIRTANGSAPFYPSGFTNTVTFNASGGFPPVAGTRALNWVHGLAVIAGTDIPTGLTNVVKLTTNNTFELLSPVTGMFQLSMDPNSGLVSGSFVNPFFGTTNVIRGAALTASNYIRGQYTSGSQIGSFAVDVTPFLVTQSIASVTLPALLSAMSEGGVLQFQGDGNILLTNALVPRYDTRLEANGHAVTLSGGGTTRLVEVPTNLAFSAVGLVFANGYHRGADGTNGSSPSPGGLGFGGGIMSLGGPVGLTNCVVTNCYAIGGNAGADTTTNGTPAAGGQALGGALYSLGGNLSLKQCTVAGNWATAGSNRSVSNAVLLSRTEATALGGGLFSEGGECRIVDSVFRDNRVEGGPASLLSGTNYGRAGNAAGGAIATAAGTVRLTNSMVLGNRALGPTSTNAAGSGNAYAGGLFIESNVVALVEQSLFATNLAKAGQFAQTAEAPVAEGGAVYNAGSLTVRDSTLERNTSLGASSIPAGRARGGALASRGAVVLVGSTFNDNVAQGGQFDSIPLNPVAGGDGSGGAIFMLSSLAVTNSTFAYNRAQGGSGIDPAGQTNATRGSGRGGAILVSSNATTVVQSTLAYNEALAGTQGDPVTGLGSGGGLANQFGAVYLRSSVVASNVAGNFGGTLSDLGYNISSDASYSLTNAGSLTNREAGISTLSSNGGFTRTIALLPQSPARDAVRGSFPGVDQRGTARPQGAYADSGAFEFVQTLPIFSLQPSGTNTVRIGTNLTYQAQAGGPGPIGYYWVKDNLQIPGAFTSVLTLTNIQPEDAGNYAAVATNSYGAVTSTVATLIVDLRPVIVAQPLDISLAPGVTTSLVVVATGPALGYTWLHSQVPIPGATNAAYTITNASPGVEGAYQVIITNYAGAATSRVAAVTWSSAALDILTQPFDQTVQIGSPVTLTVLASGVNPIRYQWLKNNVPINDATNSTLSFASAARTNGGSYRVLVTNPFLTLSSVTALLSVVAPPQLAIYAQGSTNVAVTCFGDPSRVHRLLSSTNMSSGNWSPVATNTMPGGGSITWTLSVSNNAGPIYFRAVTP